MNSAFAGAWASVFGSDVLCAAGKEESHGRGGVRSRRTAVEGAPTPRLTEIDGSPIPDLLARLRNDDRGALTTIYKSLHDPLWRLAMILSRSASTADEVLQDVFFSLWVRRTVLDPHMDIRAYLYASVRNKVGHVHRHARVVTDVESAVDRGGFDPPGLGAEAIAPDEAVEAKEFSDAFRAAVSALTARERQALQLRIEEELSFEKIGQLLGVSKMGAHKLVMRAEAKVRALLAAYRP